MCDCEHCPLSWEEWGCDDVDAGCYWYGDLDYGGIVCRLPYFIKNILISLKLKKMEGRFDGIVEWYASEEKKNDALIQAIREEFLCNKLLCYKDEDGILHECNTDLILIQTAWKIRNRYNELLSGSSETEE